MLKTRFTYLALSGAAVILLAYWFSQITDAEIQNDAAQTLLMAINLEHQGVMSLDESPPYAPSMYREPVPVWILAMNIKILNLVLGPVDAESYFEGDDARYLKYMNLLWFALLTGGAFWACWLFTSSVFFSALAALLVNVRLPMTSSGPIALGLNNLYSEQVAAALLIFGSSFLALMVGRGHIRYAAATGLSFGLLALTKAASFYVYVGLLLVLVCLLIPPARRFLPHRLSWRLLLISVLAYGIVVLPWTFRNHTQFGSWQVADRGGSVLYLRAVKNLMTAEEFRGAFFVWAPGLRDMWGRILGFSEADLQEGGRLQRLNRGAQSDFAERDLAAELAGNPEGAISYYRRARAERMRLIRELRDGGVANARTEADQALQERALAAIRQDFGRHLLMTLPFTWRGALTSSLALIACLAYALARRRTEFALFIVPTLGTIAFYGLFSHFISRYTVPLVPIAIVSGLVLASTVWEYAKNRIVAVRIASR